MDMPRRGAAILRSVGEDGDPNWQDIGRRDVPKHLRERYWIKQWSGKRWPCPDFVQAHGRAEIALTKLGRKPGDPGDAFFLLYQCTSTLFVSAFTWIEVTEICLPGQDENVKLLIRQSNGLPGKGAINPREFLNALESGLPNADAQREMADRVIAKVVEKAGKGRKGGSYHRLAEDYGRGVLIVGLPLWFAGFPRSPEDPAGVADDFVTRLGVGFKSIERLVLRKSWCPFDSIAVLWTPSTEALNAWAERANPRFYNDPANHLLRQPFSLLKAHGVVDILDRAAAKLNEPTPDIVHRVEWNRYRSIDAMVADQFRRIRLVRGPRPMGPKSEFTVSRNERRWWRRFAFGIDPLSIRVFVCIHGWKGSTEMGSYPAVSRSRCWSLENALAGEKDLHRVVQPERTRRSAMEES